MNGLLGCAEGTSLRQGIREASLGVSDAAKDQGLSLAGRQRGRPVIPEDRMGVLSGVWPVRFIKIIIITYSLRILTQEAIY